MTASTPQQPFLCVSRGWPLSGSAPPVFNDHIGAQNRHPPTAPKRDLRPPYSTQAQRGFHAGRKVAGGVR